MTTLPSLAIRWRGAISDLSAQDRRELFDRSTSSDDNVRSETARIIRDVRIRGDSALREQSLRFDGVNLDELEVPRARIQRALDATDRRLRSAMERSARNIARAHSASMPIAMECEVEPGVVVGRRPDPLGRVGVYAPGGRAAYPSSVLMGAVPAHVAGVGEVVLCSPPREDGAPFPIVLAAAALAGVDRVFAIGGAGAIAAMAYGTETVPRVDRIVGPGNAYVAEAKLQVTGVVAIDAPAGPSELLVIVDAASSPRAVALELLAQAEHDPRACAVAVVIDEGRAAEIADALEDLLAQQPRGEIIRESLAANGALLTADSREQAIAFAIAYASEHVLLAVEDSGEMLGHLRNCGTVFLEANNSVAFGDYMTGANHVLPTGGSARSYSGLSALDFVRWTTYQRLTARAAVSLSTDVAVFAAAESLPGHAMAALAAGTIQ